MTPSSVLLQIASSEDATIAASKTSAGRACGECGGVTVASAFCDEADNSPNPVSNAVNRPLLSRSITYLESVVRGASRQPRVPQGTSVVSRVVPRTSPLGGTAPRADVHVHIEGDTMPIASRNRQPSSRSRTTPIWDPSINIGA